MKVINNADIKDFCTYRLSGKIKKVVYPENEKELLQVIKSNKKYKVIGNGSNLVFLHDYDGVIIKMDKFNKISFNENYLKVSAGVSLPNLALLSANKGLSGIDAFTGISGTIGGALYMNAGAYGKNISDVVISTRVLDVDNFCIKELSKDELLFGYRQSIFSIKNYICLDATLKLKFSDKNEILNNIKKLSKKRSDSQPLNYPTAGSVFRNPKGDYAGRLIEKLGLKGMHINDAFVSEKHANFIINKGSASGEDVKKLTHIIQKKVKDEYNIELIIEQEYID